MILEKIVGHRFKVLIGQGFMFYHFPQDGRLEKFGSNKRDYEISLSGLKLSSSNPVTAFVNL